MWLKNKEIAQKRYNKCKECKHFEKSIYICKECGCFMKIKVKLQSAKCPLNKWK